MNKQVLKAGASVGPPISSSDADEENVRQGLVSFSVASLKLGTYLQDPDIQNLSDALSQIELGLRAVSIGATVERFKLNAESPLESSVVEAIEYLAKAIGNLAEFSNDKVAIRKPLDGDEAQMVYPSVQNAVVQAHEARKKISTIQDGPPIV